MSETVDDRGGKLGRELAAVLAKRGVELREVSAGSEDSGDVESSWYVGWIKGSYRIGQSVCFGCGFGLSFVLQEQRGRPRFCAGCGEKIARYVGCDGNMRATR